ncbi:ammonia monooxygenase [Mixta intestinalis]|uniref:Uncharacterized protein n=1 Tax=Mixta intestinalis TaxID=1615494 RepID=A0A6P1Q6I7_9GAMM|nr:ammonia monooxygenase [Mixta intestinalis]QHM74041.1 hypothetical protein C7M51_04402 [Mixta intestinalis]
MNTQNVKVKTATKESTERWDENPLSGVIAEQKLFLTEVCGLWNLQLEGAALEKELSRILVAMSVNILKYGVLCWFRPAPLISLPVVQPWLQAKSQVIRLYGVCGREAWELSRKRLIEEMDLARSLLTLEAR